MLRMILDGAGLTPMGLKCVGLGDGGGRVPTALAAASGAQGVGFAVEERAAVVGVAAEGRQKGGEGEEEGEAEAGSGSRLRRDGKGRASRRMASVANLAYPTPAAVRRTPGSFCGRRL